jgi:hypothetical protein
MSEKKSLVEEALLQMKNLEHVVTENAKGILASTMKEEIEELVKESLDETEMSAEDESWSNEEVTEDEDSLDVMGIEAPEMGDEMPDDSDSMNMNNMGLEDDDDELEPLDMTGASMEEIMAVLNGMGDNDGVIIKKTGDDLDVDKISFQDEDMMESLEESDDDDDDDQQDESMDEEIVYEIELGEEDDDDDSTVTEASMMVKPKGMGM